MDQKRIFSISSEENFEALALEVFHFQFQNNPVYRKFCQLLKVSPKEVTDISKIPFLPIEFFKSKKVVSGNTPVETIFT
ncbi:MAG TPA: acyl transferase, partial [Salinimicrobium sp.]|nr:acyl transferase [Salinimicrobium sp.]